MLEPSQITIQSVTTPTFKQKIVEAIAEYQHNYLLGDAHELYRALERVLADPTLPHADEIKQRLADEFVLLMFLSFPFLDEAQVIELMEKHLLLVLRHGIIVEELIGRRLDLYYDTELDSVQTRKIVEAISHNEEPVSIESGQRAGATQTVSEWIRKLLSVHGSNKAISTLEIIQFLESQSDLAGQPELKDLVRRILLLFARVQSVYVTGLMDVLFVPLQEVYALEDADTRPKSVSPVERLREHDGRALTLLKSRYTRFRHAQDSVLAEEDRLMTATRGDVAQIKRELAAASRNKKADTLIAALKILAHQGLLVSALQSSRAWLGATANYIGQKYDGRADAGRLKAVVQAIQSGTVTPTVVSEFLQYLLIEKLEMTGNDSALVGVQIGQLLGDDFEQMAYGNQDTGNFEWARHEITDQGLVDQA